ncbi:MAG TPA: response regulator [Solirubrobacteraceae bacterium]|nr:response regulator [Solirubrobacteraceae bacterium]
MSAAPQLAVLLIEDSESDALLAVAALERSGFEVVSRRVQDADEMRLALEEGHWDVALCDHVLPRFDTLAALEILGASGLDTPLIVVSGAVGEEAAASAIRHGAADFVSKDHLLRLGSAVRTQLRATDLRAGQRRAEAQFRSAFDDAPFGTALITLDPEPGKIVRVNHAMCEAIGYDSETLLGSRVQDYLHPDEQARLERGLEAVLGGRTHTYRAETRIVTAAGTEAWFLCSVSYVRAPGGVDAIAHFVDIDARKRVEDALHVAHEQALEASRLKSEFVVNMSHELRTPLNGVIGLAGLLSETRLNTDQTAYVSGIRTSGQALMGVIGGILDFSKIEAGTLAIEPVEFEPAEIVAEVCALVAPTVKEKRLLLNATVAPDVPDRVRADAVRIRQVLTNLVGNAVKFTDEGTVSVRLASGDTPSNALRFEVTDAGPGMEPGATPFEPFWQADSSMTRHHGGTGLGLAIADRMVELMGGQIAFAPAPGGGTRFTFSVPTDEVAATPAAESTFTGMRALVTSPDDGTRVVLGRQLSGMGVHVTLAERLTASLLRDAVVAGQPYGLAVVEPAPSDSLAAVVNEIAAASAIHETSLLVLTDLNRARADGTVVGGECVLAMPFGPSRLAMTVARLLGGAGSASKTRRRSRGRLLLVEDDAINQLFAVDLLKRDGWDVELAEDGEAAVSLATTGSYDAILMDCQMPKLDGYRATEEIRRMEAPGSHTPIIAVTAHATERDQERCLGAGMDGYVAKPFTTEELEAALSRSVPSRAPRAPASRRASHRRLQPVLDASKLAGIEPATATKLAALFVEKSRERIADLEMAAHTGDDTSLRELAHTLKGSSATIGALRMQEACRRFEEAVSSGRRSELAARQGDLARAFAQTEEELYPTIRGGLDVQR